MPADENAKQQFWDSIHMPVMTQDQADSLIKPIMLEEVRGAIKKRKLNKAPGLDGLSNDFYKILGPKI